MSDFGSDRSRMVLKSDFLGEVKVCDLSDSVLMGLLREVIRKSESPFDMEYPMFESLINEVLFRRELNV